jgi:hypothetical protein
MRTPRDVGAAYVAAMRARAPPVRARSLLLQLPSVSSPSSPLEALSAHAIMRSWDSSACEVLGIWHRPPTVAQEMQNATVPNQALPRGAQGVSRIVDKMLRNNYNLGYVQVSLPAACLIHAVRHPLDVALSCFAQPFEGRGLPWASNLTGALCPLRCCGGPKNQTCVSQMNQKCKTKNPSKSPALRGPRPALGVQPEGCAVPAVLLRPAFLHVVTYACYYDDAFVSPALSGGNYYSLHAFTMAVLCMPAGMPFHVCMSSQARVADRAWCLAYCRDHGGHPEQS